MLDDLVAGRVAATSPGGRVMAKVMTLLNRLRTTKMCFVAGTMLMSAQGAMPIETVRPGMEVWARDEFTQAEGWRPVLQTFTTHPEELFTLGYDTDGDGAADEDLTGTGEHPFWVEDFGDFLPMRDLRPGMRLSLARDGGTAIVTGNVSKRGPPGERFTTYNFEVAEYHTYFVGSAGVWVHNTGRWVCESWFSEYTELKRKANGNHWKAFDDAVNSKAAALKTQGEKLPAYQRRAVYNEVLDDYLDEGGDLAQVRNIPKSEPHELEIDKAFREHKGERVYGNPKEGDPDLEGNLKQGDRLMGTGATKRVVEYKRVSPSTATTRIKQALEKENVEEVVFHTQGNANVTDAVLRNAINAVEAGGGGSPPRNVDQIRKWWVFDGMNLHELTR